MGLGRKDRTEINGKAIIVRIKTKDKDTAGKDVEVVPAVFTITDIAKDVSGKNVYTQRNKTESAFFGDLVKITFKEKEHNGTPYDVVDFFINDPESNETYILDSRFANLTRNIFNSAISLENDFTNLSFTLYKAKAKPDAKKGDKEYSGSAIWQGNNLVKGKYRTDQMPKVHEMKNAKGIVEKKDYSEVNAFLLAELKALAERVDISQKNKLAKTSSPTQDISGQVSDSESGPGEDDNVPAHTLF